MVINFRSPISSKTNKQKAVALCRVSTEDQFNKNLSIPEQKQRIQNWANKNNVEIVKWVEIHHSAYRGLDEDPRVLELLEYAKNDSKVSYFLVDEKSRFARRKYLRVVWQEELRRAGVTVIGVSEPEYDRNSIHGIWLEGISETKDEARSIETAYHTTKGMMRNAATRDPETGYCYKNGGIAPDGYKNKRVVRGKDSRGKDIVKLLWEVDEERAELIRYIVLKLWLNKKLSYRKIREHLNSNTPKYDGTCKPIYNRKGNPWSITTIREICMRALEGVYSGMYYWNRTGRDLRGTGQKWKNDEDWVVIENAHPAIINLEEWEELKEIMGPIVQKNKQRKKNSTRVEDSPYLFSGDNSIGEPMFVCLNCGGYINGNQVAKNYYYLCATYNNRGKAGCDKGVNIRKEELEKKILAAIKDKFTPEKIKILTKEVNEILNENFRDQEQAEKHIKKAIEDVEKSIGNIMKAIEQGKDSSAFPLLVKQLEKHQQEKQSLEQEIEALKNEQPQVRKISEAEVLAKVHNLESVFGSSSASNKDKRMAVRHFIRQLQYNPDKGEVYVFFWPLINNKEKLKLIKNKEEDDDESPSSEKLCNNFMFLNGAGDRNRTGTVCEGPQDFKSCASASSATPAY